MRKLQLSAVILFCFVSSILFGFYGDGPLVAAKMTAANVFDNSDDSVHDYRVTAVSSEGFISGSEGSKKHEIAFSKIRSIEFDLAKHAYKVTLKDGSVVELKFAQIKTHYTSPTFDCIVYDEVQKKDVEVMTDFTRIRSISFADPVPAVETASGTLK